MGSKEAPWAGVVSDRVGQGSCARSANASAVWRKVPKTIITTSQRHKSIPKRSTKLDASTACALTQLDLPRAQGVFASSLCSRETRHRPGRNGACFSFGSGYEGRPIKRPHPLLHDHCVTLPCESTVNVLAQTCTSDLFADLVTHVSSLLPSGSVAVVSRLPNDVTSSFSRAPTQLFIVALVVAQPPGRIATTKVAALSFAL